jgi:polysaccharide deacetylase 2 family uncharacterized protein YibQ
LLHARKVGIFTCSILLTIAITGYPLLHAKAEEPITPLEKQVAVVIDDFGNDMAGTEEMLTIPIPLTIAVMPFLPTTKRDARLAHEKGHEVLVHLPMEPIRGKKKWLGPGAITTDLSSEEIRKRVKDAIQDVPYAIGINNHMGSKATADERVARIVVEVCKEKGMMILDSKTTDKSLLVKLAKQMAVPYAENELFLDDVDTLTHISKQMNKIHRLLLKQNQCIAIGHVGLAGKKTAQVIQASVSSIQKEARFVPVSKLMKQDL